MTNVFDKPNAEGKSRSVCTMLRLENDCFKETNLFATHYFTFPSSSFAVITIHFLIFFSASVVQRLLFPHSFLYTLALLTQRGHQCMLGRRRYICHLQVQGNHLPHWS